MKTPCKGCERREIGCHAKCADYANYIEKENLEHWREDDGKFIVSASGAMVIVDESGRE